MFCYFSNNNSSPNLHNLIIKHLISKSITFCKKHLPEVDMPFQFCRVPKVYNAIKNKNENVHMWNGWRCQWYQFPLKLFARHSVQVFDRQQVFAYYLATAMLMAFSRLSVPKSFSYTKKIDILMAPSLQAIQKFSPENFFQIQAFYVCYGDLKVLTHLTAYV